MFVYLQYLVDTISLSPEPTKQVSNYSCSLWCSQCSVLYNFFVTMGRGGGLQHIIDGDNITRLVSKKCNGIFGDISVESYEIYKR